MLKANLPISALNGVLKSLIDLTCIEAAIVRLGRDRQTIGIRVNRHQGEQQQQQEAALC
jgi:hypothetical protein